MQFHERLKQYRKEKGLTQKELAQKIYVSRSAVAKWENGLGLPSDDSLDAIAEFFCVNREELLSDRETETVIVDKNGKLSRQKMCLIGLIILLSVLLISFFVTVHLLQGNNKHIIDEDIIVSGIDTADPYTWFDVNKIYLPSKKACQEIAEGMSLNQVIRKIGKPQRDIGSGVSMFQFDLDDGSILTIAFEEDSKKREKNPGISAYECLVVARWDFDGEIPNVYFPYYGALNNLYSWINKLHPKDIVQVRYERAYIGVAPGHLKNISYSTNTVDIENVYRLLFSKLVAISDNQGKITGGGYVKYDFFTANNETYSITVSNNTVLINNQYYQLIDKFYYTFQYSDIDCHSFITDDIPDYDQYAIYTYGNVSTLIGNYSGLGEFEFCIYDGAIEIAPRFCLRSSTVNLLILSANQFMIEGDNNTIVYQITGEKDFSALFAESGE